MSKTRTKMAVAAAVDGVVMTAVRAQAPAAEVAAVPVVVVAQAQVAAAVAPDRAEAAVGIRLAQAAAPAQIGILQDRAAVRAQAPTGIRRGPPVARALARAGVIATTTTIPQDRAAAPARIGKTRPDHVVDPAPLPITVGATVTGVTATGVIATAATATGATTTGATTTGATITGRTVGRA